MAQISVGRAVGAGFGLIARRPLSVLAWGLLPTVLQVIALVLIAPAYISMAGAMASGGSLLAAQPQLMQVQGLAQLINLAQLFVSGVVYCAVFRAVLHPDRSAYAYLRVGAPELFLALLAFAAVIVLVIGLVLVMIPVGILFGVIAAVTHSGAGIGLFIPIVILAVLLAILFFGLRFSFVGPMMVEDGKFHLFESWTLTRGRTSSLLLIALCLFGVLVVFEVIVLTVFFAIAAAAIGLTGGLSHAGELLRRSPRALIAQLWPFAAVYAVLAAPLSGCALAIAAAPFASAYRDVALDPAATSATFA